MNIYLIGYRCCGKSSLGRLLAEQLEWVFVDTDDMVVAQSGREIAAIVAENGWDYFRRLERKCLANIAAKSRQVVATGGGIVLDHLNLRAMHDSGVVIWLKASPDVIRQRMQNDTQTGDLRPALTRAGALDEIETVLQARAPLYQKVSEIELDTGHGSVDVLVDQIQARLEPEILPNLKKNGPNRL